jgi:pimeloyl-ACP methyl ester carboxylesterase
MYIESDGAKIHFEVDGPSDAPAALLFNGAFCTLRMWDVVVPRLSESLRVVRFDIRGTGQSTPSADPEQYSFEQYALDAEAILDSLGIERTHVWAMAFGSRVGLAFAALRPERVDHLALYDASIGGRGRRGPATRSRGSREGAARGRHPRGSQGRGLERPRQS